MGVRLADLVAGTRTVDATFGDTVIKVTYRMSERTMVAAEVEDADVDHPWLVRVIESWDIEDDEGTPIPVTLESVKQVPIPILNVIITAIYGDDGVGKVESNSVSS